MSKELNKEQKEAITHTTGPLMIIAGAGTGKTTVITERVKYLIENNFAKPSEILALTFTEKAASEMEGRIDEVLPLGYTQMWVTTFHSFCDRVLRESGMHIGLDTSYTLMSSAESVDLLRKNIFELELKYFKPLGNPNKFVFGLLNHFSRLQDEDVTAEEYLKWAKDNNKNAKDEESKLEQAKFLELALAYQKYNELKYQSSQRAKLDFGDLISLTLRLFRERPNVLSEYKNRFKFILVDEFQDTNYSQNELIKLLSGPDGNIAVVGDDDQSIYKFRGAAVSNAMVFRKFFKNAKIISLTQNYRSLQGILDSAYSLITHNNPDRLEVIEKINKKLVTNRKGEATIEFNLSNTSNKESEFVSNKIITLRKSKKLKFSDFAILVRANNHADAFVNSLKENNVPYQFLGPGKLFEEDVIVVLISYLKFLTNINDDQSLYKILSYPTFGIDPVELSKILSFAKTNSLTFFEACSDIENLTVSEETKESIINILESIKDGLANITSKPCGVILYSFIEDTHLVKSILKNETPENLLAVENIAKFFGKVKTYENTQKDNTVISIVDWIELQSELGESPLSAEVDWEDQDGVKIMTVHGSKGLEFPVVFLVNLVSLRFPSTQRRDQIPIPDSIIKDSLPSGDFHLQEERRLFYVGMTRAKDNLYLTAAKYYGDTKREKKISPFVEEALNKIETNPREYVSENEVSKKSEKPEIKKVRTKISYLSYSQIETFKLCEKHFQLRYLLKVPVAPTPSQSFGNSFHKTLKSFYSEVRNGRTPNKKLLEEELSKNWITQGYENKKHMNEAYQEALNYTHYFFDNYYSDIKNNKGIELPFNFKVKDLKIGGVIDRIEEENGIIHIIDYKTGENVLSQKDADKNLQLSIYALAATTLNEDPFIGISPEKLKLSLYYFNKPIVVTTYRTRKQLDEAKEELLSWREKIESSDFICTNPFFCHDCEFKTFCNVKNDS